MAVDIIARSLQEDSGGGGTYTGEGYINIDADNVITTTLHAGTNVSIDGDGAINASNDPFFIVALSNIQNISSYGGNQFVYTADADKSFMDLYYALYRDYKRCFVMFSIPFYPTIYAEFASASEGGTIGASLSASCAFVAKISSGGGTHYNLNMFTVEYDGDGSVQIMLETIERNQLPLVSSADEGKYLKVDSYGEWVVANLPAVNALAITQNADPNKPFKSSCTGAEALAAVEANAVITMKKWSGDTAGECYRLASYMKTSTQLVLYFSKVFYNISVMELQAIAMDITFDLTNPSEFGSLHGTESNLTTH